MAVWMTLKMILNCAVVLLVCREMLFGYIIMEFYRPVAHKIYGIPQTINCANYVYFLAFKELFSLRDSWTADLDKMVTGAYVCSTMQ